MNRMQMFGHSVAEIMGEEFDMKVLLAAGQTIKLLLNYGSNGEREAMIAAFDAYKALRQVVELTVQDLLVTGCIGDGSLSQDWCVTHSRSVWDCMRLFIDLVLK